MRCEDVRAAAKESACLLLRAKRDREQTWVDRSRGDLSDDRVSDGTENRRTANRSRRGFVGSAERKRRPETVCGPLPFWRAGGSRICPRFPGFHRVVSLNSRPPRPPAVLGPISHPSVVCVLYFAGIVSLPPALSSETSTRYNPHATPGT